MRLNKKGMTLVELIVSVALISIVMGFLFKIILDVKYEKDNSGYADENHLNRTEIINMIQEDSMKYGLKEVVVSADKTKVTLKYHIATDKHIAISGETITYKNRKWTLEDADYSFGILESESIGDDYIKLTIPVTNALAENQSIDDIEILLQYNSVRGYNFSDLMYEEAEGNGYLYHNAPNIDVSHATDEFAKGSYGLYKVEDYYGDSYIYYGDVTNNYVVFGKTSSGVDLYWRIVRINGDKSIRLIFDGQHAMGNGGARDDIYRSLNLDSIKYNNYNGAEKYVGYTYDVDGVQADSTIKEVVDAWYEEHLKENYGKYLADSLFCNDRSQTGEIYNAFTRYLNNTPTLKCTNKADRYTVNDTENGNGLLDYPIALLTMDEVIFSNEPYSTFDSYLFTYLSSFSTGFWTMTPIKNEFNQAYVYAASAAYNLSKNYMFLVNDTNPTSGPGFRIDYVRPVINLKADMRVVSGTGIITDPYILKYD